MPWKEENLPTIRLDSPENSPRSPLFPLFLHTSLLSAASNYFLKEDALTSVSCSTQLCSLGLEAPTSQVVPPPLRTLLFLDPAWHPLLHSPTSPHLTTWNLLQGVTGRSVHNVTIQCECHGNCGWGSPWKKVSKCSTNDPGTEGTDPQWS